MSDAADAAPAPPVNHPERVQQRPQTTAVDPADGARLHFSCLDPANKVG
jgi:hypothetical protein